LEFLLVIFSLAGDPENVPPGKVQPKSFHPTGWYPYPHHVRPGLWFLYPATASYDSPGWTIPRQPDKLSLSLIRSVIRPILETYACEPYSIPP